MFWEIRNNETDEEWWDFWNNSSSVYYAMFDGNWSDLIFCAYFFSHANNVLLTLIIYIKTLIKFRFTGLIIRLICMLNSKKSPFSYSLMENASCQNKLYIIYIYVCMFEKLSLPLFVWHNFIMCAFYISYKKELLAF